MKWLLPLLLLLTLSDARASGVAPADKEPSTAQKIQYLQHRLIPGWAHQTDGAFFRDLSAGELTQLRAIATDLVSADYAKQIEVTAVPQQQGLLLTFPQPNVPPQCFFIFIQQRENNTYAVYTYEKAFSVTGLESGRVGVVGSWPADGGHANHGTRAYQDAESFLKDIATLSRPLTSVSDSR